MHKNRIELEGFLGHKPEPRALPGGNRVATARLAEDSYRYRDAEGREQVRTNWHTVVFYGELAELAGTFEKGENLRVVGTLLSRQFTPKDGSRPRTVWEVIAREAYVIAPRRVPKRPRAEAQAPGPALASASASPAAPGAPLDADDGWV